MSQCTNEEDAGHPFRLGGHISGGRAGLYLAATALTGPEDEEWYVSVPLTDGHLLTAPDQEEPWVTQAQR